MAKRITLTLVDDIDGTTLSDGSGETIRFAIDGRSYEIDLTDENAASLRRTLQPFVDAGRRPSAKSSAGGRRRS